MKKYLAVVLSMVLLASQQVLAHRDHSHGLITEIQAVSLAADVAKKLSVKDMGLDIGKLPASWASIPKENIAMDKKGSGYYIVSVENKIEKKTLYVLMSSTGDVYDANFRNVFKGIDNR